MNSIDFKQIKMIIKSALTDVATKDDLKAFATKDDLKSELTKYATKRDLKEGLDDLLAHIVEAVEKSKVDITEFESLEKRVEVIENRIHEN